MQTKVRIAVAYCLLAALTTIAANDANAEQPDNTAAERKELKEFTFDRLTVKVDSFAAPSNYTLTIQRDGSYVFQPYGEKGGSSRNRLPNKSIAQLEHLLKEADYLKEPPIEDIATDVKKGIVALIERTRAKNPNDPAIRSYEFALRAAPGVGMATDGTWFNFTLVRDDEKRALSRYDEELKLKPIQPLVRFVDRILLQEQFERAITGKGERVLLELNLHLDRALGRRDVDSPPPLMALDYTGLAVRLKKLGAGDDARLASRAQRAIRTIDQLPDGDFGRPSSPIPPADPDRLATFSIFTLDLKGEGDEQQHLWVFPDGWYEFRITGPPKVTEYLDTVRYHHIDRLPRETVDRLDELIVATRHFREQYSGHNDAQPAKRGIYYMAVAHEHDRGPRRMVSHRSGQAKEYDDLQAFIDNKILDLMKRSVNTVK